MAAKTQQQSNWFDRFLKFVEWLGNLLPHPASIFIIGIAVVILLSGVFEWLGVHVMDPRPEGSKGRSAEGIIYAVSLISWDGLRMMFTSFVHNFTGFAPLGTVLVALLGVGVADSSGLIKAVIRTTVLKAPKRMITFAVVLSGILSNVASELGYVVLIPLAGVVFLSLGRHPLAGMAAAFAGVSGGYSANLLLSTLDPLLAGITQEAANLVDPSYTVHAAVNYYFMMVSTVLIAAIGSIVTDKIVEPRLGAYDVADAQEGVTSESLDVLSALEKKGLLWAGLTFAALAALFAVLVIPEGAPLRNQVTGTIYHSPFLKGIVCTIFITFVIPGLVYGFVSKTFKNDRDVIDGMATMMSSLGLYLVIIFFAAQFIAYFNWTNLGLISAVTGANFLKSTGFTGPEVFVFFIIICCFVNFAIGSASAQWAVTAPIFVPMLMLIGYSPEVIQAAYRIGDSTTNIITPMMSYFGLIMAFACRYNKKLGVGTLISTMLPYSICFLVGWIVLFYVWVFVLGLPVGPAAPTYYMP